MVDQSSVVADDQALLTRGAHQKVATASQSWRNAASTGRVEMALDSDQGAATEALWRRWALTSRPRRPVPIGLDGACADLLHALVLFETAALGSRTGRVYAPSAGALYPYEYVLICDEGDATRAYQVDPVERAVRLIGTEPRLRQVVLRARQAGLPSCRCVLAVIARPWLSMRKYGDRGWMYSQLDAAHASTHLLVTASRTHTGVAVLGPDDLRSLDGALGLESRCRLPHSAIALGDPVRPSVRPSGWTYTELDERTAFHVLESAERLAWHALMLAAPRGAARHADDRAHGTAASDLLAASRLRAEVLRDFAEAASRRHSAKDFRPATLPADPLVRAVTTACAADLRTRATLVARRVAGLHPGAYDVLCDELGAPRADAALPDTEALVEMCMGQAHLRHSCAALVLHAPRSEVLGHGRTALEQALADAGTTGHLLYLAAAAEGIAITAIGGFDARRWHAAAGLDEACEVLYVLLLGVAGDAKTKVDRVAISRSHGEG